MKKQHYLIAASFMICLHVLVLNHLLNKSTKNEAKSGMASQYDAVSHKKNADLKSKRTGNKPNVFLANEISLNNK